MIGARGVPSSEAQVVSRLANSLKFEVIVMPQMLLEVPDFIGILLTRPTHVQYTSVDGHRRGQSLTLRRFGTAHHIPRRRDDEHDPDTQEMNGIVAIVLTLSVPLSSVPVKPTTPPVSHQVVVLGEAGK
jgi:hypothetical protein